MSYRRAVASVRLFCSCSSSPEDHTLREQLEKHLAPLRFELSHAGKAPLGDEPRAWVQREIDAAGVILVLISADYLASVDLVDEMNRALLRRAKGEAIVVPILLRACNWPAQHDLQVLPRNGIPIANWPRQDDAFAEIAKEIGAIVRMRAPASEPEREASGIIGMHPGVEHLFVGRAGELAELERVLLPDAPAPMAIGALQGMPGVGKSYLADRFAYLHGERFPGGYVKVSLSPDLPRDGEELAGDLAAKVDLPWGGQSRWEQLRARLQHPRTLVHIENADNDDLASATAQLAARLTGCTLLVSGRSQRIGKSAGWRRLEVKAFDEAAAIEQLKEETGITASGNDLESFKRLAGELGYLPLALHLAGGHLREGMSIEGFRALLRAKKLAVEPVDLDDPLVLQDKARSVLSTSFALSLDLLKKKLGDRGEAWLASFAMLGHAPPSGIGRSLGAAMAGLTELELEHLMLEATHFSLASRVIRQGTEEGAWSLHPLLAEFLRGRNEEDGQWLERMTKWFLARLPELPARQEEEQGRRRTEAQRERDALVSWLALVPLSEAARVERAGSHYAYLHGPFPAWLAFCERLLRGAQEPKARSHALWTLCQVALKSGAIERAKEAAGEKARLDRERGEEREALLALTVIVDILQARGQLDEALRVLRGDMLPVFERLGDVRSRALAMLQITDILQAKGELVEALRILFEDVLPVFMLNGDVRSRTVTMGKVADILQMTGQLDEALRIRCEEELPVFERLGDVRECAVTKGRIADIFRLSGRLDEALRIRREDVLPVFERLGDVRSLVRARANLALIHLDRGHPGDPEAAAELLRLALRDAEAMRIPEAEQIRAIQKKHGLS